MAYVTWNQTEFVKPRAARSVYPKKGSSAWSSSGLVSSMAVISDYFPSQIHFLQRFDNLPTSYLRNEVFLLYAVARESIPTIAS